MKKIIHSLRLIRSPSLSRLSWWLSIGSMLNGIADCISMECVCSCVYGYRLFALYPNPFSLCVCLPPLPYAPISAYKYNGCGDHILLTLHSHLIPANQLSSCLTPHPPPSSSALTRSPFWPHDWPPPPPPFHTPASARTEQFPLHIAMARSIVSLAFLNGSFQSSFKSTSLEC